LGRGIGGFFVDNQDAAQDEAEGVRNDGRAARREAALSDENDDAGESRVDLLGGFEGRDNFAKEFGGEVGAVGSGKPSAG
jgi:hypothetical protein